MNTTTRGSQNSIQYAAPSLGFSPLEFTSGTSNRLPLPRSRNFGLSHISNTTICDLKQTYDAVCRKRVA